MFKPLTYEQVRYFFINNDIPLQFEEELSSDDVDDLLKAADIMGSSFGSFVIFAVINADQNGIRTNFDSWTELYQCYIDFMLGYDPIIPNEDSDLIN